MYFGDFRGGQSGTNRLQGISAYFVIRACIYQSAKACKFYQGMECWEESTTLFVMADQEWEFPFPSYFAPIRCLSRNIVCEVSLGRDHRFDTDELFILKSISKTRRGLYDEERNALQNLSDEAKPYCTQLLEYYENEDEGFLLFPYYSGFIELFDYAQKPERDRSDKITKTILENLYQAVRALHRSNIAHRDIRLDNILVHPDTGEIRLINFGNSCCEGYHMQQFHNATTYAPLDPVLYEPRESPTLGQYQAGDLWSMGICVYEVLAGHSWFDTLYRDVWSHLFQLDGNKERDRLWNYWNDIKQDLAKQRNWLSQCWPSLYAFDNRHLIENGGIVHPRHSMLAKSNDVVCAKAGPEGLDLSFSLGDLLHPNAHARFRSVHPDLRFYSKPNAWLTA
jgi:serine/threonine protein kinase